MSLRKYHGSISFVPAPDYEAYGEPVKHVQNSIEQNGKSHQDPSVEFQGSDWRSLYGPFVAIWINNMPWGTKSVMITPKAEFSDGYVVAVIIKDCPKFDLLGILLKIGDGSYVKSKYVTYIKVRCFKLTPGPVVGNPERAAIIDVDGEVIARGDGTYGKGEHEDLMAYGESMLLIVQQGLATIYSPK